MRDVQKTQKRKMAGNHDTMRVRMNDLDDSVDDGEANNGGKLG